MRQVFADVNIGTTFTPITKFTNLGQLVSVIVQNAFVIAGVIFFILLIFGGVGLIVGAGSGDTKQIDQSKQAVTGAVVGLLIIIGSIWIIQIVKKLTGITLPGL